MELFKYLSASSSLAPTSTISPIDILSNVTCGYVNSIETYDAQCDFVLNNGTCSYEGVLYSYTTLTYCQLGHVRPVALLVLIAILLMLFVTIGSVADDFLCPSLLTISNTFHLPDHIAGVTFLALGNAAPDVFSSISGISQSKPHLVFSSLYGGGIFITTVVTGTVLFSGEFSVMKRPLVRDIVFYIGAALLVWLFIFNGVLKVSHSLSLVGYYIIYIVVMIVSRYVYVRYNANVDEELDDSEAGTSTSKLADIEFDAKSLRSVKSGHGHGDGDRSRRNSNSSHISAVSTASNRKRAYSYENGIVLTRFFRQGSLRSSRRRTHSHARHHAHHHFDNTLNHITRVYEADRKMGNVEDVRYKETIEKELAAVKKAQNAQKQKKATGYHNEITFTNNFGKPKYLQQFSTSSIWSMRSWEKALTESKDFFIHICPLDVLEWKEYRWYRKALELVKAVPYFIMTVCIPVVDIESPNENWCRLLTCLNVICAPQMVLFLYAIKTNINGVFPLWALLLLASLIISVIIFFTSEKSKPPVYHRAFGFVGFVMSVVFINAIAEEVIAVLTTFGIIFNLSDSILGLTVLAWGNSLGDLIADNSLARHGYPGIAIAACFGGPMLNLLMGVGLPYSILFISEETTEVNVEYTSMNTLLFATIMTSLCTTLTFFLFNRFKSSKLHGSILLAIYIVYIVFAVLIEFKVFG